MVPFSDGIVPVLRKKHSGKTARPKFDMSKSDGGSSSSESNKTRRFVRGCLLEALNMIPDSLRIRLRFRGAEDRPLEALLKNKHRTKETITFNLDRLNLQPRVRCGACNP